MRYPALRNAAMRTLSVPDLAGGINNRDGITDILDNQLNNAKNLWFKDGVLRTRPGKRIYGSEKITTSGPMENTKHFFDDKNTKNIHTNIQVKKNDKTYRFVAFACILGNDESTVTIYSHLVGNTDKITLSKFTVLKDTAKNVCDLRLFFVQHAGKIYAFNGEERKILSIDISNYSAGWQEMNDSDMFAPVVCIGLSAFGDSGTADKAPKGTMIGGYNLIGHYYKAEYTTVNLNLIVDTSSHKMNYYLLCSVNDETLEGLTITVKYTAADGSEYTHIAIIQPQTETIDGKEKVTGYKAEEDSLGDDDKRIVVENNLLKFLTSEKGKSEVIATVTKSDYVIDNMVVTAPVRNDISNMDKVFACSFGEWYGGSAEGLSGGTRLFLGGNRADKSLILWSALNNPLYFSENTYARVGLDNSEVTAFGKQSNMLIIFKENEIWETHYVQNSTTEDAITNQSVYDMEANSAYFPLVNISSTLGCDLANTIQLCNNRLVWAHGKKVYTLVSNNQYSENNIFTVSDMIRQPLNSENMSNSNVFACDQSGYYWLFIGNRVYVMDYNSYGYRYISSYSKTDDAAVHIPWWTFNMPLSCENSIISVFSINDELVQVSIEKVPHSVNMSYYFAFASFDEKSQKDLVNTFVDGAIKARTELEIPTSLETKVFDFGVPQFNKNIYQVDLGIRSNGGMPINVSYMNESSERISDDYISCAVNADDRSSRNIQNIQLRPSLRGCSRFGLRLECEGGMSINHIAINYKITGGAK